MLKQLSERRIWTLHFLMVSIFLVVIYQLLQLTILRREPLLELAQKQHRLNVEIPPLRGSITDQNGRVLAMNLKTPSVYAVPRMMGYKEKPALARKVSHILDLDEAFVLERFMRDKSFVWLKRKVTHEQAKAIQKLSSPGLGLLEEYKRFYPQGNLLAQILGFTDVDNRGIEGIELLLDKRLRGRPGSRLTKRDALGREIKAFEIKTIPAVNGNRVTLTIDQYIQYLTERALDKTFEKYKPMGAWAIVMEAKTGRILAMANRPTYNLNKYSESAADHRRNRAITDMYEPGSVFKIVAASALLNEGAATPGTTFFCENGEYRYGSHVLHDVHSYGKLSLADIVIKSSNIGTVKAAALLEPETLQSYIEGFGFGRITGIDLPGEAPGYTRPPAEWSKTSPYNIPIGHEIMVTALQITTAMGVIANQGKLMRPYLIEKVTDDEGVVMQETKPLVRRQVIRPETAKVMRSILTRVVEEGTGKKAQIDGIHVGGKTGTAQKVLPDGKGYSHSNFIGSFVGFGPSEDPDLVMGVVVDDPHPVYYGGTVAAPVFREVMEAALLKRGYIPEDAKWQELLSSMQTLPGSRSIYQTEASQDTALALQAAPPGR